MKKRSLSENVGYIGIGTDYRSGFLHYWMYCLLIRNVGTQNNYELEKLVKYHMNSSLCWNLPSVKIKIKINTCISLSSKVKFYCNVSIRAELCLFFLVKKIRIIHLWLFLKDVLMSEISINALFLKNHVQNIRNFLNIKMDEVSRKWNITIKFDFEMPKCLCFFLFQVHCCN